MSQFAPWMCVCRCACAENAVRIYNEVGGRVYYGLAIIMSWHDAISPNAAHAPSCVIRSSSLREYGSASTTNSCALCCGDGDGDYYVFCAHFVLHEPLTFHLFRMLSVCIRTEINSIETIRRHGGAGAGDIFSLSVCWYVLIYVSKRL